MKLSYHIMVAALATTFALEGTEAHGQTLKLSHFVPTTIGLHSEFMEPWARALESCTNGAVTVDIYPAGSAMGNIANQFDQVRAGVVDIAFGHTGIPRGRFPRTALIELPFLSGSANANSFALWNLADSLIAPDYPGVRILAMMAHNPGVIHTNVQISDLADLAGLRIRTPNPAISLVLEHFGAEAVGLPPGEMYENLQRGTIDGVAIDWNGIGAYNLGEVVSHHFDIPLYTVGFFFAMNQRSYDRLSDSVRACVDSLSGDDLVAQFGPWWDAWGATALAAAQARPTSSITVATPEQIEAARLALADITEQLMSEARAAGVNNTEEIRDAMAAEIARRDAR